MARHGYLSIALIAVFVIFMAVSFEEAIALKCWKCSSDSDSYCTDSFDETAISPRQRRSGFVTCPNKTIGAGSEEWRPACKKVIKNVAGKEIIARACHLERLNSTINDCMKVQNVISYIKTEYCETCTTDGCNGAALNEAANDDEI